MSHSWTPSDVATLRRMREERKPFAEIAAVIGSTEACCFRTASAHGITWKRQTCIACGKRLTGQKKVGRKRQYCSSACANTVIQAHRTNQRIDSRERTHCVRCGSRLIPPWTSKKKFCSRLCGQQAWYREQIASADGRKRRKESERLAQVRRDIIEYDLSETAYDRLGVLREGGQISDRWMRELRNQLFLRDNADLLRYAKALTH